MPIVPRLVLYTHHHKLLLVYFLPIYLRPFIYFNGNFELDLHSVYNFYYLSSSLNQMEQHIYNNMLQAKTFYASPAASSTKALTK